MEKIIIDPGSSGYNVLWKDEFIRISNNEDIQATQFADIALKVDPDHRIEALIDFSSKENTHEALGGIGFLMENERNGFAFVISPGHIFQLISIYEGEWGDLKIGPFEDIHPQPKGIAIALELDQVLWKFYVSGKLVYACPSSFALGNKVGQILESIGVMEVNDFTVLEKKPDVNYAPLPFDKAKFRYQLARVICAAPGDFNDFEFTFIEESKEVNYYRTTSVAFAGASEVYLSRKTNIPEENKSRNFVIEYKSAEPESYLHGLHLFAQILKLVEELKPPCGLLHYNGTVENISPQLIRSTAFELALHELREDERRVLIQLDFREWEGQFYTYIQVLVRN